MAGYSSLDQIVQATTAGQFKRVDWNKNFNSAAAAVAGEWHCLAITGGNPAAGVYNTGTNLAFQATSEATANAGGIQTGIGDVSPMTKHILNASAFTAAATTAPCVMMLVDLLGFYRVTSVTTITAQTLDNTVTLPRYTTGAGVQAFTWTNVVMGAGTPNLSINYTNQAGTAGKTTPTVLPSCKSASNVSHINYSGTGAGKYGPFIPLAAGDSGIRSIQSVTLSASYVSGEFAIGLCRPLLSIPLVLQGVATERDYINAMPSLPRIYDGANLHWLIYNGAATPVNSAIYGHLDIGWN